MCSFNLFFFQTPASSSTSSRWRFICLYCKPQHEKTTKHALFFHVASQLDYRYGLPPLSYFKAPQCQSTIFHLECRQYKCKECEYRAVQPSTVAAHTLKHPQLKDVQPRYEKIVNEEMEAKVNSYMKCERTSKYLLLALHVCLQYSTVLSCLQAANQTRTNVK